MSLNSCDFDFETNPDTQSALIVTDENSNSRPTPLKKPGFHSSKSSVSESDLDPNGNCGSDTAVGASTSTLTTSDANEIQCPANAVSLASQSLNASALQGHTFPTSESTNNASRSSTSKGKKRPMPSGTLEPAIPNAKSQVVESSKVDTSPVGKRQNRKFKQEFDIPEDGFKWRKYGQKKLIDTPFVRTYFACAVKHNGCTAKKTVDRHTENPSLLRISYEAKHNHEPPASPSREVLLFQASTFPQVMRPASFPTIPSAPRFPAPGQHSIPVPHPPRISSIGCPPPSEPPPSGLRFDHQNGFLATNGLESNLQYDQKYTTISYNPVWNMEIGNQSTPEARDTTVPFASSSQSAGVVLLSPPNVRYDAMERYPGADLNGQYLDQRGHRHLG